MRLFRPAMVSVLGRFYLAVDEVQPVAATVSPAGELVALRSWAHLPPPGTGKVWPRRRLSVTGSTGWLSDLPDGPTVALIVDDAGGLQVTASEPPTDALTTRDLTTRDLTTKDLTFAARQYEARGTPWRFDTQVEQFRWTASVAMAAHTWNLGRGSIASFAGLADSAAACVRRADKRPWLQRAPHELYVFAVDGSSRRLEPVDITEHCWPRRTDSNPFQIVRDYLDNPIMECRWARDCGIRDIELAVTNVETDPVIEYSFELDGVRFRRTDLPMDELGNESGGLARLGILLVEDLNGWRDAFRSLGPGPVIDI